MTDGNGDMRDEEVEATEAIDRMTWSIWDCGRGFPEERTFKLRTERMNISEEKRELGGISGWRSSMHRDKKKVSFFLKVKTLVSQLFLSLCNFMDSPPGSSVHGILQARILEWVAMPFSRGLSSPRDRTWFSCTVARFFTI